MANRPDIYKSLLLVLILILGSIQSRTEAAHAPPNNAPKPVRDVNRPQADESDENQTTESAEAEPNSLATDDKEPNEPLQSAPEPNQPDPNAPKPVRDVNRPQTDRPDEPQPTEPARAEPNSPETNDKDPNEPPQSAPEPNQPDPDTPKIENNDPNNPDANDIVSLVKDPNSIRTTEPNDPNASPAITFHSKCAPILKSYVSPAGKVNYKKLVRKKPNLKDLLEEFNRLEPNEYDSWPREDKIALWINAYNIKMLEIITQNYPIKPISKFHTFLWGAKSVRHIEGKWTKKKFKVMDGVFTLLEIEEEFFRKEFPDPRILFALNRASLSGPPLRNEPYRGCELDKQLDEQARKFLSNPLAFKIDKKKGKVYLSALFQKTEYAKTFLKEYAIDRKFKGKVPETRAVLNFITNYVSEETKEYLELGNYTVQFMGYNWTINDGL
ncbi:MAG: DUF547 domain-containing protein [Planctomycetota bacterium]|jgi:hypothetical protein